MNRIQELIKELCPNGVEWKTLGEVCVQICSGGTPNSKTSAYYGGDIPWLRTQEVNFCDIYTTEMTITKDGLDNSSAKWIPANCVIVAMYGATVGKIGINKIPLTTNQACCNLQINSEIALYRYVFYCLCSQYEYIKSLGEGSQTNINAQIVRNLQIPLPPLSVQTEIVRILDKFVEQQEQLEKLIELRTKQYEYYREEMLTAKEGEEWETKTLGECCKILKGKYITQKDSKPGPYPVVLGGQEPAYYIDEFNHSGEVIAVSRSGVSAGFISYWNQDIFVSDGFMLEPLDCSFKYLYMYLKSKQESINSLKRGAGIPHITTEHLKELVIPIFPSSKENEIVNALDSFESSISALTSALELSKKRYEHYRDELLRF